MYLISNQKIDKISKITYQDCDSNNSNFKKLEYKIHA